MALYILRLQQISHEILGRYLSNSLNVCQWDGVKDNIMSSAYIMG